MDKGTIELATKIAVVLGTAIAFIVGFWEYRDTKKKEFYAEFWNKRLAIYAQASEAAAKISVADSLGDTTESRRTFWTLFYGPMSIVEDSQVKEAMQAFGTELRAVEKDAKSMPSQLQQPSYRLSIALRNSLAQTWNRPFVSSP
jgi:hypothetical protein